MKWYKNINNSFILNDMPYMYNFIRLYLRLNNIEPTMLHPKYISEGLFYWNILFNNMLENNFSKKLELV